MLLFVMTGFGLAGLLDDYLKLTKRSSAGISGKKKLALQFLVSGIACAWIMFLQQGPMSTTLTIPFFKNLFVDLWWFYVPFALIVMVGTSNAVNLTDGLDGLVSVPVIMSTLVFMVIAYLVGRVDYTSYLQMHYVIGVGEMVIFCGAIIGAVLGFLWFNAHPAQVFMGDTGSLTIGGIIGVTAILIHKEILLVLLCGIFVVENLSVILQVAYYKKGKKKGVKQRIFRRTPLHHHYNVEDEKLDKDCTYIFKGPSRPMHEAKITLRFCIVTIIMAAITLMTLKIR
jgi:phospho-N-acetylmuramoyl-pentapeptide-transferase